MKKVSLYIHIPFCIKKCGYCDFISFVYDEEKMEKYLNYIKKEILLYKKDLKDYLIDTVFIGGGTPSLLYGKQMIDLMNHLKECFDFSVCREISMESNPGTLSLENLYDYKSAGINRISIGVQTLNNSTLKSLDRIHDVDEVYQAIEYIKEVGLVNFNMDLMFSLPGQTLGELEQSVEKFIELEPTHISAYSLKYEEGTAFFDKLENDELIEATEELDRKMYHLVIDKLEKAGYLQYEISNFSKTDFECKHNLVYWENKNYVGIGLGAHSSFEGNRFYNEKTFGKYFNKLDDDIKPIVESEEISREVSMFETIMLSLRLNKGMDIEAFNKKYKMNFEVEYEREIKKLKSLKLITINSGVISLSDKGRDLSNQVFIEFL